MIVSKVGTSYNRNADNGSGGSAVSGGMRISVEKQLDISLRANENCLDFKRKRLNNIADPLEDNDGIHLKFMRVELDSLRKGAKKACESEIKKNVWDSDGMAVIKRAIDTTLPRMIESSVTNINILNGRLEKRIKDANDRLETYVKTENARLQTYITSENAAILERLNAFQIEINKRFSNLKNTPPEKR